MGKNIVNIGIVVGVLIVVGLIYLASTGDPNLPTIQQQAWILDGGRLYGSVYINNPTEQYYQGVFIVTSINQDDSSQQFIHRTSIFKPGETQHWLGAAFPDTISSRGLKTFAVLKDVRLWEGP